MLLYTHTHTHTIPKGNSPDWIIYYIWFHWISIDCNFSLLIKTTQGFRYTHCFGLYETHKNIAVSQYKCVTQMKDICTGNQWNHDAMSRLVMRKWWTLSDTRKWVQGLMTLQEIQMNAFSIEHVSTRWRWSITFIIDTSTVHNDFLSPTHQKI